MSIISKSLLRTILYSASKTQIRSITTLSSKGKATPLLNKFKKKIVNKSRGTTTHGNRKFIIVENNGNFYDFLYNITKLFFIIMIIMGIADYRTYMDNINLNKIYIIDKDGK